MRMSESESQKLLESIRKKKFTCKSIKVRVSETVKKPQITYAI